VLPFCKNLEEKNKKTEQVYWESNRYIERHKCAECLSTNCYTRIFVNEKLGRSFWFCRNCAQSYVEKEGFELLVVPITYDGEKQELFDKPVVG
jgi:hypothetical protein